ncbi:MULTISPECIES: PAS domain S-box protein [Rhodomicrobium]|uniref:PAS domain S-box protein n=1 Tax=Rhodomicrobium TaxID=1068 RepID=UPI000B4AD13E|nr:MULTISPECIES: PAS domain S-box protein [Rhodomicrobium]
MARILIIDDNPDDRAACLHALEKADKRHSFYEAADEAGALAIIEAHRPDCVLLDYSLPVVTGLETLRRIRGADAFLPVIMVSGRGNEAIAVEAMREGAQDYIVKSALTPKLLNRAVLHAIGQAEVQRRSSDRERESQQHRLALTSANRLQAAILESASTMIFATDLEGRVNCFTRAAESALGYSARDVIGLHTLLLWFDEAELDARAQVLANGHGARLKSGFDVVTFMPRRAGREIHEWTFIRKDGSRFPVRLTMTPLRDDKDAIVGFLGLGEDISELKQQDFSLQTSEETFVAAAGNAANGMALISPDGIVLKVNPALCTMLGYSERALAKKHIHSLTHADDIDIGSDRLEQLFRGRIHSYRVEKRLLHANGEIVHGLINGSLMRDADGAPKYCVVQIQDITERKEMERIKSEFISIVSHELRTPLTSIRGSLGLLTGKLGTGLPDTAHRLIDIANKNCERLIFLVNDILDIDKIASGSMRFDLRPENTVPILEEAIESIHGYADALGVNIRLVLPPSELKMIVDRQRLIQVLNNLLSNALKFSPLAGEVSISAEAMGDRVRIRVEDHGPGIPEEFQHQMFKPFFQADAPMPRRKGGTGLGLHISRQLVKHMGGQIGFETVPGEGTTLWIEIPALAPEGPDAQGARAGAALASRRVLVCEDDEEIAALIQAMLIKEGFVADVAHSIAEAREKVRNGHYAAMTLDLLFPQGSGAELARELRLDGTLNALPIIVVSGTKREGWPELTESVGIIDWLVKPVDRKRLLYCVTRATAKAAIGAANAASAAKDAAAPPPDRSAAWADGTPAARPR